MGSNTNLVLLDFEIEDLIEEKDVYKRFPGLFTEGELPTLRKGGKISCFKVTNQRVFYRKQDIKAYLCRFYISAEGEGLGAEEGECLSSEGVSPYSSMAGTGSTKSPVAPDITAIGATVEELAAESLLQLISTGQRPNLSASSSRSRRQRGGQKM